MEFDKQAAGPFDTRFLIGISNVYDGNMSVTVPKDVNKAEVLVNRRAFWSQQGIPENALVVVPKLVHGSSIIYAKELQLEQAFDQIEGDIFLCDRPGVFASFNSADCVTGIVMDHAHSAWAMFHAGKKGASLRVAEITISAMKERFDSKPEQLKVRLGPSIAAKSYVFADRPKELLAENSDWLQFIRKHSDGYHVDVREFVRWQLVRVMNVKWTNVALNETDTFHDPMFFSHRRSVVKNEPEGRFTTVAGLLY